jgi:ribosome maturation factor RimP
MSDRFHSITGQVEDLVEPVLEEMGFELVSVQYLSKYGRWVLRLYIDKEGGVTIDDCARVSGEIGDLIDVKDVIEHQYVLEVSSPGLDRPLKKERDLTRAIGKKIKVIMGVPLKGRRNFTGDLKDYQDGQLLIETNGEMVALPWSQVDRANLVHEFGQ